MAHASHPIEPGEVMAYLDGELRPRRAASVAAHLEECNDCRILAEELRGVSVQLLA
jgi:anti-sigma factor RsiW